MKYHYPHQWEPTKPKRRSGKRGDSMTALQAAQRILGTELVRALRENDNTVPECDEGVNDGSRAVVTAMATENGGTCWLGQVNRDNDHRDGPALWPHCVSRRKRGHLYNFGASFAVPREDSELIALLLARETAPYTTTAADGDRIDAIYDRVATLGGAILCWS